MTDAIVKIITALGGSKFVLILVEYKLGGTYRNRAAKVTVSKMKSDWQNKNLGFEKVSDGVAYLSSDNLKLFFMLRETKNDAHVFSTWHRTKDN